jgi:hypothetical protein
MQVCPLHALTNKRIPALFAVQPSCCVAVLQVVQDLVSASLSHDWAGAHAAGKTQFLQKAECCSGTLEGCLLRFLVAATGARTAG